MEHLSARRRLLVTIGLCLQSFFVMFSYALSRPATESLFLEYLGKDKLPLAWLAVALGSILVVMVYNRVLPKADLVKLFGQVCLVCAVLLALLIVGCSYKPGWLYYILYVWKDIYVVILVEIFYTYTNTVLSVQKASWIYGFFGAIGSIGGLVGNMAVGGIAKAWGSMNALWLVVPLLLVMAALGQLIAMIHGPAARPAAPLKVTADKPAAAAKAPFLEACKVVGKSSYLWLALIMICLVQVGMTLIDFEYNDILQKTYTDVDQRTAVIGNIYAIVSGTTLLFNVLTGPIINFLGVAVTMVSIPAILAAGTISFVLFPVFGVIAAVKVASKVLDYSLLKAVRQLLYIPLSYEEKTAGKSIVDMLVMRLAKGGASLILIGISAIQAAALVSPMIIVILCGWALVAVIISKRFMLVKKAADEQAAQTAAAGK